MEKLAEKRRSTNPGGQQGENGVWQKLRHYQVLLKVIGKNKSMTYQLQCSQVLIVVVRARGETIKLSTNAMSRHT